MFHDNRLSETTHPIAWAALPRLASALIEPTDSFETELSLQALIGRLTVSDRTILANIVRKVAELEEEEGPVAATRALEGVFEILTRDRGPLS